MALDLAQTVLMREEKKKEALDHAQQVWEKRQQLADLKRRFPTLGIKEDEELLFEKERSPKKAKADAAYVTIFVSRISITDLPARTSRINVKIRTGTEPTSPASHVEPAVRPRERYDALQSAMQSFLQRYKERDVHWEDAIDVSLTCVQLHFLRFSDICYNRTHINHLLRRTRNVNSSSYLSLLRLLPPFSLPPLRKMKNLILLELFDAVLAEEVALGLIVAVVVVQVELVQPA